MSKTPKVQDIKKV